MRTALILVASVLTAASSAAADPWTRLRNATANELCWDTVRGFAREKYPTVKLDDPSLKQVNPRLANLGRPVEPLPVKQSRKSFPGIRTC